MYRLVQFVVDHMKVTLVKLVVQNFILAPSRWIWETVVIFN